MAPILGEGILLVKLYPCKVRAKEGKGPETRGVAPSQPGGGYVKMLCCCFPKANEEVASLCGWDLVYRLGSWIFFPSCFGSSNGVFPRASWNDLHTSFH